MLQVAVRDVCSHLNRSTSCCVLAANVRVSVEAMLLVDVSEFDRWQRLVIIMQLVLVSAVSDSLARLFIHLIVLFFILLMVDLSLDELFEAVIVFFVHLLFVQGHGDRLGLNFLRLILLLFDGEGSFG